MEEATQAFVFFWLAGLFVLSGGMLGLFSKVAVQRKIGLAMASAGLLRSWPRLGPSRFLRRVHLATCSGALLGQVSSGRGLLSHHLLRKRSGGSTLPG